VDIMPSSARDGRSGSWARTSLKELSSRIGLKN
jgi:hypothetical protein